MDTGTCTRVNVNAALVVVQSAFIQPALSGWAQFSMANPRFLWLSFPRHSAMRSETRFLITKTSYDNLRIWQWLTMRLKTNVR